MCVHGEMVQVLTNPERLDVIIGRHCVNAGETLGSGKAIQWRDGKRHRGLMIWAPDLVSHSFVEPGKFGREAA